MPLRENWDLPPKSACIATDQAPLQRHSSVHPLRHLEEHWQKVSKGFHKACPCAEFLTEPGGHPSSKGGLKTFIDQRQEKNRN